MGLELRSGSNYWGGTSRLQEHLQLAAQGRVNDGATTSAESITATRVEVFGSVQIGKIPLLPMRGMQKWTDTKCMARWAIHPWRKSPPIRRYFQGCASKPHCIGAVRASLAASGLCEQASLHQGCASKPHCTKPVRASLSCARKPHCIRAVRARLAAPFGC